MNEPVRLVIWDLDDTFWRGALSEGGIQSYVQAHHDVVVELARRGIMSSICSKNDLAAVRAVLEEKGLWDYFIFPSIDWSPKGGRVAGLIEAVQLRAASVLFIDDNPSNRAEAAAMVPGLRVVDENYIAEILTDPLCQGRNDPAMTRLAHYKLLEARQADFAATAVGGDNRDFLRGCDIQVTIETDIEDHLDRAVELINRTNQLNFTKLRLSDDPALARRELAEHIGRYSVQAGLIRVTDRYGDYGYCGFYSKNNDNNNLPGRLVHFCFSCRILGMGVEQWLYARLRRPPFHAKGEVLVDFSEPVEVDWINQSAASATPIAAQAGVGAIPEIRFHGGCDLSAVAHYFKLAGNVTVLESNYKRDEIFFVRKDFACSLLNALEWSQPMQRACQAIGYGEGDVASGLLTDAAPGSLLVFSGWGDVDYPLYRHRDLGFRVPCMIEVLKSEDISSLAAEAIEAQVRVKGWDDTTAGRYRRAVDRLRHDYTYDGLPTREVLIDNMRAIFNRIPEGALLAVILPHEVERQDGRLIARPRAVLYNKVLGSLAAAYENVMLVDIADYIRDPADKQDGADHFHRVVYYRLYQGLMAKALPRLKALAEGRPGAGD